MKFKIWKISAIIVAGVLLVGLGAFLERFFGRSSQNSLSPAQQSNVSLLSRIMPPSKPIPNPVIEKTLTSLRRMASAAEVGINSQEYGKRVIDLKFEVEEGIAKLPDSELKQEIKLCLQAYIDAATVWGFRGITDDGFVFTDYEPIKTLQEKYAIPKKKIHSINGVYLSVALNKIWEVARKHLERSTELQIK
jgi:hypothetical protein